MHAPPSPLETSLPRDEAAAFDVLAERWREHWLDPRLVESWTCDVDAAGELRLVCTMGLPEGVRAEVPPPLEQRIAIGGTFLDEVRISRGDNTLLSFPPARHRGVRAEGGAATVYAMMPAALQLLADGRLPRIGQGPIESPSAGAASVRWCSPGRAGATGGRAKARNDDVTDRCEDARTLGSER